MPLDVLLPSLLLSFRRSRLTISALASLCILVLLFVVLARVRLAFFVKSLLPSFVSPPLCTRARKFSLAIIMNVCDLTAANSLRVDSTRGLQIYLYFVESYQKLSDGERKD